MYSAVKHFAYFIKGQKFHIYIDHKPLTFACSSSSDHWTSRKRRHLAFIAEHTTDMRHVHGRDNALVDAPPRVKLETNQVSLSTDPPSLDLLNMARVQQDDAKVQAYRTAITKLTLADLPIPGTDATLLCYISTGVSRPIVPPAWRHSVFNAIVG